MKINKDFIMRNIADEYIIVPIGRKMLDFNGLININESGAFLFELLQKETDKKTLVKKLLAEYDVDEKTAEADVDDFIENLVKKGIISN